MPEVDFIRWVNSAFSIMPVGQEPFFKELWDKGKLRYADTSGIVDVIDRHNAKLICTALDEGQLALVVLPDDEGHRGATIFATALLKSSMECIKTQDPNHRVLYFGTSLGFKHSLSKTSVRNVVLDKVFTHTQMSGTSNRNSNNRSDSLSTFLPEVVCVYHPIHPEEFIQIYDPDWIAVDCSKESEISWLNDLLAYCKKKNKPVIGWCQNNFSNAIELFDQFEGKVFFAPKKLKTKAEKDIGELFLNHETCIVEPLVFSSDSVSDIDKKLFNAKALLHQINSQGQGQLRNDALKTGWLFLRTLERLTIPVSVYNEQSQVFKYVYSFESLEGTLKRYIELIKKTDDGFARKLENLRILLKEVLDSFDDSYPPYWTTLSDLCTDRSLTGTLRVIVFPKRHQCQLFAYTLLAKFNIKEDELLNDSGVVLKTLKEFGTPTAADLAMFSGYKLIPIIAGLPDFYGRHLFYRLLNKEDIKVLIYPHQLSVLNTMIRDFNRIETHQLQKSLETLKYLAHKAEAMSVLSHSRRYELSTLATEIIINGGKVVKNDGYESSSLLKINDLQTELSQLLEDGERDEEDLEFLMNLNVGGQRAGENEEGILVESVIEIQLQDNYHLLLATDEEVNIIKDKKISKIFVRAVKSGDRIVLIENQSRQTLYDLIIARVHNHPSLEIHLGMLRKWRGDFYLGYTKWKAENANQGLDQFLELLRQKGSKITSSLTVNNWVNGYVMRPQDEVDIKRIGEILELKFLSQNYGKICGAASRIIGIHISLSKKLNDWIANRTSNLKRDDMELVDKDLGLTFGELRSSIRILKAERIIELNKPTLQNHLGRLEKMI